MKAAGKKRRRAKTKSGSPKDVPEYVAALPVSARKPFMELRAAIRSAVPAETVEVISYRIPAFKYKKILVWYAAFANHCSLFPTAEVINLFREELKAFSVSKGTVQFSLGKPLPENLIRQMVKTRTAIVLGKTGAVES